MLRLRSLVVTVSIGCLALFAANCTSPAAAQASADLDPASRGTHLFLRHCAVCHGADGEADTLAANLLLPRPTAFRHGLFKLVSHKNGMPSDDDLVATLRRGMPGSTMMAWDWLPEADLRALAGVVRQLAVRGRATAIERTAAVTGQALTPAQARELAEQQLRPGAPVETGAPRPVDAALVAAGETLFQRHCASCHGADGRGLPGAAEWPTDGTWLRPRDFTAGYLRGGATHQELACRIRAGMPGAHMPPVELAVAETEALVAYVQNLIPDAARRHHVQWRRTLRVERSAALPADGDAAGFDRIEAVRLPVAPLWWRAGAANEVWLRAAHDGEQLLLQLEWADGSRDERPRPEAVLGDGVAVQFARTEEPPLFAMGSTDAPVAIWRWQTFDPKSAAGQLDLTSSWPHTGIDVPIGVRSPAARGEAIEVTGVGTASGAVGSGRPLQVAARWRDDRWTVTFRRALHAGGPDEVDFKLGTPTLFALAVWNGSLDPNVASKVITTWHVLELQR